MKKCKNCKNCKTVEISQKASFCSDKCRKAYSRNSDKITPKSDTITVNSDKLGQVQNWQRIGLKDLEEYKAYIVWYLRKQGILDNNIITIGNRIYGNYKQRALDDTNQVKEFRKS